jgi:myo-inositol catabolism protein IolC
MSDMAENHASDIDTGPDVPPAESAATDPLLMLAFDHRRSIRPLFGLEDEPSTAESLRIGAAKEVILDGLERARDGLLESEVPALLVDEEFGSVVLERGRSLGLVTALACERSGQAEFRFEHGEDFRSHIERIDPDYVKALVRFNPDGDAELNGRQIDRLQTLSVWLRGEGRRLLFELLVPPEQNQLAAIDGDRDRYDAELRPELVRRSIERVQDAGIEVAVWKIEGIEERSDCARIAASCRRDGRSDVDCLILGRGADQSKVEDWLRVAAPVAGIGGFAVGRTIWWDAIAAHLAGEIDRGTAADRIARRYLHFAEVYRRASTAGDDPTPPLRPR